MKRNDIPVIFTTHPFVFLRIMIPQSEEGHTLEKPRSNQTSEGNVKVVSNVFWSTHTDELFPFSLQSIICGISIQENPINTKKKKKYKESTLWLNIPIKIVSYPNF